MKNRIPCEIIKDVMPSYVDGLTSDVTNKMVEEHTGECESCRELLETMKEPTSVTSEEADIKEIDFLKKTRKRNRIITVLSIAATALLIAVIIIGKTYFVGHPIASDLVKYKVKVNGKHLTVRGSLSDNNKMNGLSGASYKEEDGVVTISFHGVNRSPFSKSEIESEYTAEKEITQVCVDSNIVWYQGENITKYTSDVYNARHPYVGCMPDNSDSASALLMYVNVGDFINELQTSTEPYGWKIMLQNGIKADELTEKQYYMKAYAYSLIATISNLGEVTFAYAMENDAQNSQETTFTAEEATEFYGSDIKECGNNIISLQKLLVSTGLETTGIAVQDSGTSVKDQETAAEETMQVNFSDIHYPDANTRDNYDTIHNVRKAQELATGKGIKVGILDWCFGFHDGLDLYEDGVDFMTFDEHKENFEHERGHGYWMASTLREIAPDVEIYALGTFNPDSETEWVDSLIKGIDWAIDNDIDIMTLSHQMITKENRARFDEAVNRALAKGIVTTFIHYDNPDNILPWGLWEEKDPEYNREPDINIFNYDYNTTFLEVYGKMYKDITFRDQYKDKLSLSVSSMSVVTAGFVAMMMEKDDSLTAAEYRDILVRTSRPVEYDGDTGEHTVDIYKALKETG